MDWMVDNQHNCEQGLSPEIENPEHIKLAHIQVVAQHLFNCDFSEIPKEVKYDAEADVTAKGKFQTASLEVFTSIEELRCFTSEERVRATENF
ncbi:hypothetical protein OUZ56_022115 [Daphnia magna]|uniref:Uncharacterized protein n=1 Tax=Daphnia magna TaxID=35525 RepID=A0ABR0AVC5_9CRUS|nr:hypothetical protein OUZ56_022115 [Daphnia magna]